MVPSGKSFEVEKAESIFPDFPKTFIFSKNSKQHLNNFSDLSENVKPDKMEKKSNP